MALRRHASSCLLELVIKCRVNQRSLLGDGPPAGQYVTAFTQLYTDFLPTCGDFMTQAGQGS